jgi:hypothetical protein
MEQKPMLRAEVYARALRANAWLLWLVEKSLMFTGRTRTIFGLELQGVFFPNKISGVGTRKMRAADGSKAAADGEP